MAPKSPNLEILSASDLPSDAVDIVRASPITQLATVTLKGVPIVDALIPVAGLDGRTIDCGTGLAYPGKADRARRNPRVGLLFTAGGCPGPVLTIGATAAVRDADLQANTDRWVAAYRSTWMAPDTLDRAWDQAVCYFVRIFVNCTPVTAAWWPDGDLNKPPIRWRASPDIVCPESDPAPTGPRTSGPPQPPADWRTESDRILAAGLPAPVITRVDDDGFPLPVLTRSATANDTGFDVELGEHAPWATTGVATLSFEAPLANPPGVGTGFVGRLAGTSFEVERVLAPNYRAVAYRKDPSSHLFQPNGIQEFLMARLRQELKRRGATMPTIRGLDATSSPT